LTPDLFTVLDRSLHYSKISQGAFDITAGPLVELWRRARRDKRLPGQKSLKEARKLVGYSKIILDRDARTARLRATGMKLDLGGIAKGYAVDQALAVLSRRGIRSALVALGGDVAVSAAPPALSGWRIAIRSPISPEEFDEELILRHCGVSTSGDTEQFMELDGIRYSHIVDPRTGWSLRDSPMVSVIAPDSTTADALATALSVLPSERGLRLAESQEGVAVRILERSGDRFRCVTSRRYKEVERRKSKVESRK
jgi:FAD:protein FMN transferase